MRNSLTAAALLLLAPGWPAEAQAPLSAIDWLSESVTTPAAGPFPAPGEHPVSGGTTPEVIEVTPLDQATADAVGLLPVNVTGLPRDLWGPTPSGELARLIQNLTTGLLPAVQELLFTVLLAELDPPADSDPASALFLARIDALLALGAVDPAQALLERAGPDDPETFRRWFDASLLTGTEDRACARLRASPDLSPKLPARIFCLARGGDWNAAALTLETGRALGEMTAAEDALLTRFLDAEIFEGAPPLPPPARPSPLKFRLYEAIGEPLPTTTLPLAFAQADLRSNTGWKAQIEAAERLARSGAVDENLLLGLYTERLPAASGGVWDRVEAVQRLDLALTGGDPARVAATLPGAWFAMRRTGLVAVLARAYAPRLAEVPLAGEAAALGFRVALLGPGYETAAQNRAPADATERFLKALARGDLAGTVPPDDTARAIAEGFRSSEPPEALAALVGRRELGAAILRAMAMLGEGAEGDPRKLADAIALFRALGLEDAARRAALQVMILDRQE